MLLEQARAKARQEAVQQQELREVQRQMSEALEQSKTVCDGVCALVHHALSAGEIGPNLNLFSCVSSHLTVKLSSFSSTDKFILGRKAAEKQSLQQINSFGGF